MSASDLDPRLRPILGLAEAAAARPGTEADLETLRAIFAEAAMLLDLGNVLDEDPTESIRAHAESVLRSDSPHDPEGVAVAYRMAADALRL
jgi:hypothetical protein